MRTIHTLLMLVVLSSLPLLPHEATAVPANNGLRVLTQPDGTTFEATLRGDEWLHRYELPDGAVVMRDVDNVWKYATSNENGAWAPSGGIVGRGPAPATSYGDVAAERAASARRERKNSWARGGSLLGTSEVVIILVEFSDTPGGEGSTGPHDATYFDDPTTGIVLGSDQGKLRDYIDEVSYGQSDIQGVVANGGWHVSSQTELFYGADCSPGVGCDPGNDISDSDNCNVCIYELVREAVQLADSAGFDFAPYDTDVDGVIDHVMIVHSGHNQAALAGVPDDIWSHRWEVPGGGEPVDGKVVEGYTMVSEHDAMSVLAHEFSHDLGAPDLYDYDGDDDPVGRWCNMSYNFESERPPHLCGLLKIDIDADSGNGITGWVTPVLVDLPGVYNVDRIDQLGANVILQTSTFSGSESFIIENRQRSGFYDNSVPESGILFTHTDPAMPDGPGAFNDGTPFNSYHGAWIERPLGLASPDQAAYSLDDGETRFTPVTVPNTNANGGVGTGLDIDNISAEGDVMTLEVQTGPTDVSGTTSGNTVWALADSPFRLTGHVTVSAGDTLTIEPGVVVKFNTGTRLTVAGELIAEGTVTDSIVFTSYRDDDYAGDTNQDGPSAGVKGDWIEIHLTGAGDASSMSHCRIRYAGRYSGGPYYNYVALRLTGTGRIAQLDDSIIELTAGIAAYPYAGTTLNSNRTTYQDGDSHGVNTAGVINLNECQFLNNIGSGVSGPGGSPQLVRCLATGNNGEGINLSGSSPVVTHSRIVNNGGNGLVLTGSSPHVEADTVETHPGHGIYVPENPAAFFDNVSTGNGRFGYQVDARVVSDVWNLNVVGTNGANQAIGVHPGTITATTTWIDEHPYVIVGSITVAAGVDLSLESGVVMKFNPAQRMTVLGELIATGTESDPIVFTSYRDDEHGGDTNEDGPSSGGAADWIDLKFDGSGVASSLSYCLLRYGGRYSSGPYYDYSTLRLSGSGRQVTITNCIVENVGPTGWAVRCHPGTELTASECVVRNCQGNGVLIEGVADLTNCHIHDTGGKGLACTGSGSSMVGCRVENNAGTGIEVTGSNFTAIADSTLNNGDHGLLIQTVPAAFQDNVSSGNGLDEYVVPVNYVNDCWLANTTEQFGSIGSYGGTFSENTTWVDQYVYVAYGDHTVPSDLTFTLEAGSIFKFGNPNYALLVNGLLLAEGTEFDRIIFTSRSDDDHGGDTDNNGPSSGSPGQWEHVRFLNTNAGNSLQYCTFRYGGDTRTSTFRETVIADAGSDVAMTNCVVEYSLGGTANAHAVAAYDGSNLNVTNTVFQYNSGNGFYSSEPTTLLLDCTATDNGSFGFYVDPELVGEAVQDNAGTGNYYGNAIGVTAGTITIDDEWPADNTYVLNGSVTINPGATLVPFKGTVIKFNGNYDMIVDGNLVAQGDAVDKIVFTSFLDDAYGGDTNENGINTVPGPGDWGQIRFQAGSAGSDLGWTVIAYGGAGNDAAVQIDDTGFDLSECILTYNQDEAIQVGASGELVIHNSDIYGNSGGLVNLNGGYVVDATSNWWGDASGPSGEGPGSGDPVSINVLYDPWLDRSIDNPWIQMLSPTTSGNYTDVLFFDFDGDALLDLVGATEESGIEIYPRTGFEEWDPASPATPISSGQVQVLGKGDFDGDLINDLLTAGPFGIRVFAGDAAGGFTEAAAPLAGLTVQDAKFAFIDLDAHLDIIACSGDNGGIWIFYGDGAGNWTTGVKPSADGSFNRVDCDARIGGPAGLDIYTDIVATSAEFGGVRTWYGDAGDTWTEAPAIGAGNSFFGLALGDIDQDGGGLTDIAVGTQSASDAIDVFYNADGMGNWTVGTDPTSSGIYNDLVLAHLNDDTRLDLAAASQGGGVNVWIQGFGNAWNFWYHPASNAIFNRLYVEDFTLNGSLDLAGAATIDGVFLWDNQTPGVSPDYFVTDPNHLDFGPIAIGQCAYEQFQLTNSSPTDTLFSVFVYSTNAAFEVDFAGGGGGPDIGPFDLLPSETVDIEVTFCPFQEAEESELIIIHSAATATNVSVTAEGVPYIAPLWTMNLFVENSIGGPDNSDSLSFGAGIGATDAFDPQTGEVCLPPVPPVDVFDTRFEITGCEGSLVNIHDYYLEQDSFILGWQTGAAGGPVTVSWDPGNLPEGTFLISDIMGGVFQDTLNMADTSMVVITESLVTDLVITTTRKSSFDYDLNAGWHLLSLAVDPEDEDSLTTLFPGALSAFTWNAGYVQVDQLNDGWGYWVNMSADSSASHLGFQVSTVQRNLAEGWSLVGTVWDTVSTADIQEVPAGSIQSIFGFDGSYVDVTNGVLLPGQGYWFDVTQAVEITIERPPTRPGLPLGPIASASQGHSSPSFWEFPIQVESTSDPTSARVLTVGVHPQATEGMDLHLGERGVPPTPPATVFEARLQHPSGSESYLDIRQDESGTHSFELQWQAGTSGYPVRLSWDPELIPNGTQAEMFDALDGERLGVIDLTSDSEVTIPKELSYVDRIRVVFDFSETETVAPTELALYANVPNPFRTSTAIRFDLPTSSAVRLAIFDPSGRRVRTLKNEMMSGGTYTQSWDGRDEMGRDLSSGIYFYRLSTADRTTTRRLLLLK